MVFIMAAKKEIGRISYSAPIYPGLLEDDIYVSVGGKEYLIKRGEEVKVPPEVVYAIQRSERLKLEASRRAQAAADTNK